jgi:hypothetical protein
MRHTKKPFLRSRFIMIEGRFDHRWLLSVSGFCAMVATSAENSVNSVQRIESKKPYYIFFLYETQGCCPDINVSLWKKKGRNFAATWD